MPFKPDSFIPIAIPTATPPNVETKSNLETYLAGLQHWQQLGLLPAESLRAKLQIQSHPSANQNQTPPSIDLHLTLNRPDLLQGLQTWTDSGLLNQATFNGQLYIDSSHPSLMQGLNHWLQLNLLTDQTVLGWCRQHLHCDLPTDRSTARLTEPKAKSVFRPLALNNPSPNSPSKPSVKRLRWPSIPIGKSLMAELSVIWLLLLGIILVLLSSGVLVANQWERFPASGQYGILWAYTFALGLSALWAGGRDRLRLTARALQIVTLSLVPLNVIAMDGFDLWREPVGLGVLLLAMFSLTGLTIWLYRIPSGPFATSGEKRPWLNHLWLSAVHLGWDFTGIPGLAVYCGVVGTTVMSLWQRARSYRRENAAGPSAPKLSSPSKPSINFNSILMMYGLGLLLIRAIFGHHMPISQLGFAIGTWGFLMAWTQGKPKQPAPPAISPSAISTDITPKPSETLGWQQTPWPSLGKAGWIGILLGWAIAIPSLGWQALGVSLLVVLLFRRRLFVTWSRVDLTGLLLIGLQSVWLMWEMVPAPGQAYAQALGQAIVGTQGQPWAALSLVFFPYLVGIVVFSDWLGRHHHPDLAKFSGWIALWLGTGLVMLGALNPTLRVASLAASTLLLAFVTRRRWQQVVQIATRSQHPAENVIQRQRVWLELEPESPGEAPSRSLGTRSEQGLKTSQELATLTHLSGVLTTVAVMMRLVPTLNLMGWSLFCLTIMFVEGAFSLGPTVNRVGLPAADRPTLDGGLTQLLRTSAWPLSRMAAILTYLGLWSSWLLANNGQGSFIPAWGLMGGMVPVGLTVMAGLRPDRRRIAAQLSLVFLLFWPALTWGTRPTWLLSLSLATGLMVLNTRYLQTRLAAWLSIGFGLVLLGSSTTQIVHLWYLGIAITALLLWIGRHQLSRYDTPLVNVYRYGLDVWAFTLTGLMVVAGSIFYTLAYSYNFSSPSWVEVSSALLFMVATTYRSRHLPHSRTTKWFSLMTILFGQLMTVWQMPGQAIGLAWGVGLLFLHSYWWQKLSTAVITIGMTLGLEVSLVNYISPLDPAGGVLVAAVTLVPLWQIRNFLMKRSSPLARLYAKACDGWAIALGTSALLYISYDAYFTLIERQTAPAVMVLAAAIMVGALVLRHWQRPLNWGIYAVGWSLELLVIEGLSWLNHSLLALAVANVLLGVITQLLGDWLQSHRRSSHMLRSWHILPLIYGGLGAMLRADFFNSWTGLSTLGLVLIAGGIGRRQPAFKPLIYVAIAGISAMAFELTFYQIQRFAPGDQVVAIAALATTMVYAYRILPPSFATYLRLVKRDLVAVAHIHWAIASGLLLSALNYPIEQNALLSLGVGLFLVRYAIQQGRHATQPEHPFSAWAELWVYLGGLEALGLLLHGGTLLLPPLLLQSLLPWLVMFATGLATVLYGLPWPEWGWPRRPWQVMSGFLPMAGMAVSYMAIAPVSLLTAAGFYGVLAVKHRQLRWSYLSVLLMDWAVLIWLDQFNGVTPVALACVVGLSTLYPTWVDPLLQQPSAYKLRHYIRLFSASIICLVPLLTNEGIGLLPASISLLAIFAGLVLRIRAFLQVGTLVFLLNAIYQLLILSVTYPFLKWVVGLIAGIAFIIIAANFETRRAQLSQFMRYWLDELKNWG